MNMEQILAVKCAYADLVGAYQCTADDDSIDVSSHDWESHLQTIQDLEKAFNFIEPIKDKRLLSRED